MLLNPGRSPRLRVSCRPQAAPRDAYWSPPLPRNSSRLTAWPWPARSRPRPGPYEPAATPSWQLTDQYTASPACFTTAGGTEYLELNLNGTWSTPLTFGASGLPAGGSFTDVVLDENLTNDTWSTGALPIPAGWSNGTGPLSVGPQTIAEAYPVTTIPAGLKANSTLTITFWASDGTTKQTESVPIAIKTSCARRY